MAIDMGFLRYAKLETYSNFCTPHPNQAKKQPTLQRMMAGTDVSGTNQHLPMK
jgi:hypothetical protein